MPSPVCGRLVCMLRICLDFFTERNKRNDGKIAYSSIIYKNSLGLLVPSYDVTMLLIISFLEGTEIY